MCGKVLTGVDKTTVKPNQGQTSTIDLWEAILLHSPSGRFLPFVSVLVIACRSQTMPALCAMMIGLPSAAITAVKASSV